MNIILKNNHRDLLLSVQFTNTVQSKKDNKGMKKQQHSLASTVGLRTLELANEF